MVGITSYGVHIPRYRMDRKIIFQQMGWFNMGNAAIARGEKAVANHDEDANTMAHAAAQECMGTRECRELDGLYMASMSFPYANRQNAVVVSSALGSRSDIRTADFTGAVKSGTTAMISALDAIAAGSAGSIMVCAADCRFAKPGSAQEITFGDGAAAVLLGKEKVVAAFKGSFSVSHDFMDSRRLANERFDRVWEDRWIRDEGYMKIIPEAALGIARKYQMQIGEFEKIVIACPNEGALKGLAKVVGARPDQIQGNFVDQIGDTGVAMPLLMMVAAIEESKPGDKILVLSYGYGSDALCFEVTEEMEKKKHERKGMKAHLAAKEALTLYTKYQAFRDLVPFDIGIRGESISPTAMTVLNRQGSTVSALVGVKCKACGTPQFPSHTVCVNPACGAVGQMEPYRFSHRTGKVVYFAADHLAFSWDPPLGYVLIDFPEGGRLWLELTDHNLDQIQIGTPVEMTFRRKYSDPYRGHIVYYWKAKPVKQNLAARGDGHD